jgi:hypothetical protein
MRLIPKLSGQVRGRFLNWARFRPKTTTGFILSLAFTLIAIKSVCAQTNRAGMPARPVSIGKTNVANATKPSEYFGTAVAEFLLDKPRLEIQGDIVSKSDRSLVVHVTRQLGLKLSSQVTYLSCGFGESCTNRTAIITGHPQFNAKKIGERINIQVYLLEHTDYGKSCLLKCFYMAKPLPLPAASLAQLQAEAFHGDVLSKSAGVLLIGKPVIVCSIVVNNVPGPCWQTGWDFCLETGEPEYESLKIGDNVVARGYITGTKVSGSNTWINVTYHNFFNGTNSALIDHNPQYTDQKIKQRIDESQLNYKQFRKQ